MRIKYLSTNRKRLNAILIVAILFSFAPLFIIFLLLLFGQGESYVAAGLMIISLIAIFLAVIMSLLRLIIRPQVTLAKDSFYELEINTDKDLSEITEAKEIQYCGNFLKHEALKQTIEIDNQETFNLLKGKSIQFHKVQVKKRKTNMLHESPGALLREFLVSMGTLD